MVVASVSPGNGPIGSRVSSRTAYVRRQWQGAGMSAEHEGTTTWARALAWRLERHLLDPVGDGSAADVVRRLGAILAMDQRLAELAVATRRTTREEGALARALEAGEVIVGFTFRGALHYLTPEEGGMYSSIRTANRQWELRSWVDHYRLSPEDWPDFRATVREVLRDAGPLSLPELWATVGRDPRWRHLPAILEPDGGGTLVKPLSWQGDLSFVRRDGRWAVQSLETNPHWGGTPPLDEAGPRALLAYVRTYGPVTRDHVEYWFGSCLSAGRKRLAGWFDGLREQLAAVDVGGTTAYVLGEDLDSLLGAEPSDAVRLLPGHDQWVMGVGTSDETVVPPQLRESVTRKADLVLHGGVVRGTWRRRGDDVVVAWQDGPAAPRSAVDAEVARVTGAREVIQDIL